MTWQIGKTGLAVPGKVGKTSDASYLPLTFAAQHFGPSEICANLGRTSGEGDPDGITIL